METLFSSASIPFPREPVNFDEIAMHQNLLFQDSFKDLKNLRKQLYSAAEYFELSYTNDDQKQIVVDTLKDYAIKALVNTVDHLGAVSFKVNNLIDEKIEEVSGTEIRVSCIEQRLRTCQGYFGQEGVSQQSLLINIPKYHKRYILPVEEIMQGNTGDKVMHQNCIMDDDDHHHHAHTRAKLMHQVDDDDDDDDDHHHHHYHHHEHKNVDQATISEKPTTLIKKGRSPSPSPRATQQPELFSFTDTTTRKDTEKTRAISPRGFPILHSRSFSASTAPNSTPNPTRPTTPPRLRLQEPRKSVSMQRNGDRDESDKIPSKSKRLLKALLSRRKSKKDEMLYTYLDEY